MKYATALIVAIQLSVLLFQSIAFAQNSGNVTYTLHKDSSPSADQQNAYEKITSAMDKATEYYNTYTTITKALNIYYEPSVATADGSSNGTIRFGENRSYMVVLTALHEIAHTVGIGTTREYKDLIQNKVVTGPHATAMLRELTGNPDAVLKGDEQHFWPYGLNYASEFESENDYVFHCKIVNALYQDMFQESFFTTCFIRSASDQTYITATEDDQLILSPSADSTSIISLIRLGDENIFRLALGSLVLDIPNESTQAGVAAGIWNWNGGNHQKVHFEFEPDSSTVRISMVNSGLYLCSEDNRIVQNSASRDDMSSYWEIIIPDDKVASVAPPRTIINHSTFQYTDRCITFNSSPRAATLTLFDCKGRMVHTFTTSGKNRISLNRISCGMYLASVRMHGITTALKIIVQ